MGLFFFLFLVLFDSSVSILSRRLNQFLVSAVGFGRVDTFSHSYPLDDGVWSILDYGSVCHVCHNDLGYPIYMKVARLAICES